MIGLDLEASEWVSGGGFGVLAGGAYHVLIRSDNHRLRHTISICGPLTHATVIYPDIPSSKGQLNLQVDR